MIDFKKFEQKKEDRFGTGGESAVPSSAFESFGARLEEKRQRDREAEIERAVSRESQRRANAAERINRERSESLYEGLTGRLPTAAPAEPKPITKEEQETFDFYNKYAKDYSALTPSQQSAEAKRLYSIKDRPYGRTDIADTMLQMVGSDRKGTDATEDGKVNARDLVSMISSASGDSADRYKWLMYFGDEDALADDRKQYAIEEYNKRKKNEYEKAKKRIEQFESAFAGDPKYDYYKARHAGDYATIRSYEKEYALDNEISDLLKKTDFEAGVEAGKNASSKDANGDLSVYDTLYNYARSQGDSVLDKSKAFLDWFFGGEDRAKEANRVWSELSADEKNAFYYTLGTKGMEEAAELLDRLVVNADKKYQLQQAIDAGNAPFWSKVGKSIASIPQNVIGGPINFFEDLYEHITGRYNPYTRNPFNEAQATRTGISQQQGALGQFVYNTGMSVGDSLFGMMLGQAVGAAAGAVGASDAVVNGLSKYAYSAGMGMSAASSRARELYEQGATKGQLLAGAGLAGIAETLFEHWSIENLLSPEDLVKKKDVVFSVLKQSAVEGSEEFFTGTANLITDYLVRSGESDIAKKFDSYLAQYKDAGDKNAKSSAFWATFWDETGDLFLDFLGGLASGILMSGAADSKRYHSIEKYTKGVSTSEEAISTIVEIETIRAVGYNNGKMSKELDDLLIRAEQKLYDEYGLEDSGVEITTNQFLLQMPSDGSERAQKREAIREQASEDNLANWNMYASEMAQRESTPAQNETAPGEGAADITQEGAVAAEAQQGAAKVQQNVPFNVLADLPSADQDSGTASVTPQSERRVADQAERDEAAEKYVAPDTVETGVAERTGKLYGATPYQRGVAAEFAAITGRTVRFEDPSTFAEGESARYEESTGAILLNPESTQPVEGLLTHEFLHSIENTEFYSAIKEWALKKAPKKFGAKDIAELRTRFRERYSAEIAGMSEAEANEYLDQEIVAMFGQKYMFSDMEQIRSLAQNKPTAARRVRRFLGEMLRKHKATTALGRIVYSDMKRAYDAYGDALRAAKNGQAPAKGEGIRNSYEGTGVNPYTEYDKPTTQADVDWLRLLFKERGRISINEFTHDDLVRAQKWAYMFWRDIDIKSPFFRAWLGDWRAYDEKTKIAFVPVNTSEITPQDVPRMGATNADTGWHIGVTRDGVDETGNVRNKWSKEYHSLSSINEMLKEAVLLDTVVVVDPSERLGQSAAFMHHFYCPVSVDGVQAVAKLYVAEKVGNKKTFYLTKIETVSSAESTGLRTDSSVVPNSSGDTAEMSVAQIFEFVKNNNDKFEADSDHPTQFDPKPVNPALLNKDGTPMVFYHGTDAEFTAFDPARFNTRESSGDYVGEGFFFSTNPNTARKYGKNVMPVYLQMSNPLVIETEQDARDFRASFSGMFAEGDPELRELIGGDYDYFSIMEENPAAIREELQRRGYDGLIDKMYGQAAVFTPGQIKSATDNIGTFDRSDDNIRHSYDDVEDAEGDEMIDRWREETLEDLEGTREQRERKADAEAHERSRADRDAARDPNAPEEPAGYRPMSDNQIAAAIEEREKSGRDEPGSFVRSDDGERRLEISRALNGFAEEQEKFEGEKQDKERQKAINAMNKILSRAAAQYFAEESGVPSEEIDEIKKLYGSDAAVLGALASEELHNVTHRNTAAAMERLAGEAKAIREGREARAKAWGELFGEAKRRVVFEGDEEVLAWNKNHLDDLISRVISDNGLTDNDVYLAGLIASGERDASHIPNEAKKRAITLLADMYATRNALDGKAAKTSPLVDLGVWIESPLVSNYMDARAVIGLENARKDLDQQIAALRKGIAAELGKERAAKIFSNAQSIADHINTMKSFADLTKNEEGKLWNLARLLRMRAQLVGLGTGDVRVRVKEQFGGVLQKILPDPTKAKRLPKPVLKSTTFVRNNISTFGEVVGETINEALFRPIVRNEAEKIRFENRELREFSAACGSFDADSSALLQFMIERGIGADNVDRVDMRRELDMYLAGIDPTEEINRHAEAKKKSRSEKKAAKYSREAVEAWGKESERMKSSLANISDEELSRIARAADFMRGKYAIYYEAINEFLVMHGYKPIPFRTSYAPHMQSEAVKEQFSKVAKALGIGEAVFELPTSIAGRTDAFRPGKQWDPHFQERVGKATLMDAVTGFERYISYMSEVLYHTDDVQKLRQFSEYLRTYFADDTIKKEIESTRTALAHGEIDAEKAEEQIAAALEKAAENTALGNYVTVLEDFANVIAGKQTRNDRWVEDNIGRGFLNVGRRVQNAFVTASIVGNLSSAINQTVQLPMVAAECGYRNFSRAVADVRNGNLNRTIGFDDMSTFITGKRGVDRISEGTKFEKLIEKGQIPFELVDDLASRIVVRAKYFQLIDAGVDAEEALRKADEYADSVIGSRMKGAKPLLFHDKNVVTKLFSTFQLEVANAWDHIGRDMPREIRALAEKQGKSAAAKKAAAMILKYLLSAFLLNRLFDELYGQTPVMFDVIGYFYESVAEGFGVSSSTFTKKILTGTLDTLGEFDASRFGSGAKDAILDDVPYVSSALAMFGDSSSRLPLPNFSKLQYFPSDISAAAEQIEKKKKAAAEHRGPEVGAEDYLGATWRALDGLWSTAKGIVPFGNQLNKTATGITASIRGGGYDRKGNLTYPQGYGSFGEGFDSVTSYVFGSGANDRAGDYYASGYQGLNERGTGAYRKLIGAGMDHGEAFDLVRTVSAFAPDEVEREPSVAEDLFTWYKEDYLYKQFMTDAEKAAEDELQSRVEKQIAYLDGQSGLTDEQKLIAFGALCADKKISGALERIHGEDAGELYGTVRDIMISKYAPDGRSKSEIIAESSLSEKTKGELWLVTAASSKEASAAVEMREAGESVEDIYSAYSGITSAKSAAKDAGEVQATAGRAAIAASSLSDEAKYDMYIGSYGESAKAPGVMADWVENGATKAQAVKWMTALDSAKVVGHDAYAAKLGKDVSCDSSAGGETAAQMEALLGQGMTPRELEVTYFGMMCPSSAESKRREQFDSLKDAGGNALDFFEAYVAVSKATWKKGENGAKSKAVKAAIDSTGATRKVRVVLYDIFEVAKSAR